MRLSFANHPEGSKQHNVEESAGSSTNRTFHKLCFKARLILKVGLLGHKRRTQLSNVSRGWARTAGGKGGTR